uniref:Uncharacterized protein n=1 Tax=Anopheles merus TaxID=30066 RepID=A0A182VKN8_ANOME
MLLPLVVIRTCDSAELNTNRAEVDKLSDLSNRVAARREVVLRVTRSPVLHVGTEAAADGARSSAVATSAALRRAGRIRTGKRLHHGATGLRNERSGSHLEGLHVRLFGGRVCMGGKGVKVKE